VQHSDGWTFTANPDVNRRAISFDLGNWSGIGEFLPCRALNDWNANSMAALGPSRALRGLTTAPCASPEVGVECVLGNLDTQYSVSHFQAFSSDPRSNGSASINLVHRICTRTRLRILLIGLGRQRDTEGSPLFSPSGRNDHLPDTRKVQGTALQRLCRYSDWSLLSTVTPENP